MYSDAVATPIDVLMKSTWPEASTMRATSTASSIVVPPSISSSPHSRTPSASRLPITPRTAATISSSSRARLASEPP